MSEGGKAPRGREKTGKDRAMLRVALAALTLIGISETALAQWGGYGGYGGYNRSPYYDRPAPRGGFFSMWGWDDDEFYRRRSFGQRFQSGGARPAIQPLAPKQISFPSTYPVGSVVIDH